MLFIISAIFVYVIINIISLHGDRRRGYGENPALDQVAAPANAAFIQLSYITFGEGFGNFYILNTGSFFTLVETLSILPGYELKFDGGKKNNWTPKFSEFLFSCVHWIFFYMVILGARILEEGNEL